MLKKQTVQMELVLLGALLGLPGAASALMIRSASGADPAAIQAEVDAFRADLGDLNPNVAGSFPDGRRQIDWDGVPDGFAAPNALPPDFFNVNSPRGAVFSTPGTGVQVSANAVNPTNTAVEFGNLDASFPGIFRTFSAQRLFTAVSGSSINPVVDVNFFVPGSNTPALVSGFGAVFTDVDLPDLTSIEYFGGDGASLGIFDVPEATGDETLSFLGVSYGGLPTVSRVRLTNGGSNDDVVMDDFIYGEPQAAAQGVPEPSILLLLAGGLTGLWMRKRPA